jgi:hypothetical protein
MAGPIEALDLLAKTADFRPGGAVLAGLTAGLPFLVIVWDAIAGGITGMGYLYLVGAGVAPRSSRGTAYALGLAVHTVLSAVFGLVYAGLIGVFGASAIDEAASLGLLIGLVHGAVALLAVGWLLARIHPLARSGRLPKPGRALTGYGRSTPVVWMIAHAAFGLVVGAMCVASTL